MGTIVVCPCTVLSSTLENVDGLVARRSERGEEREAGRSLEPRCRWAGHWSIREGPGEISPGEDRRVVRPDARVLPRSSIYFTGSDWKGARVHGFSPCFSVSISIPIIRTVFAAVDRV